MALSGGCEEQRAHSYVSTASSAELRTINRQEQDSREGQKKRMNSMAALGERSENCKSDFQ
jgi:hypothetical protein